MRKCDISATTENNQHLTSCPMKSPFAGKQNAYQIYCSDIPTWADKGNVLVYHAAAWNVEKHPVSRLGGYSGI